MLLETYEPREKTLLADLVRSWKQTSQAPNVCFLGSSLMQCALKNSDPTFLSKVLPQEYGPASFSWALGGENASDSYMIASSMMSREKKPRILIYGIAPRDLLDNNVLSPVSTDIFRYLSTIGSVSSLPTDAFVSIDDRVGCFLRQIVFLVDRKSALTKYASAQAQAMIPNVIPSLCNVKAGSPEQQKLAEAQAQIGKIQKPNDDMAKKIAAFQLLQNVSKGVTIFRYNPYCAERYNRQVVYLDMLLSHLDNIGVQLVIIKMPLKNEHVAIMPKELIASYTRDVDRLATKYGASVFDFNTPEFKDLNYGDVAHLNPTGAKIFQAKLLETFKTSCRNPDLTNRVRLGMREGLQQ
jgi:hypothetical protein